MTTFKKTFSVLLFTLIGGVAFGQDIIVTKDAKTIEAQITEVNVDNIKYKLFYIPSGPVYTMRKSEIASITYQNGTEETFTDKTQKVLNPSYSAEKGVLQMNDKEQANYLEINQPELYTSEETTLRKGFELQGDVLFLYADKLGDFIGANFIANYRFNPTFALGVGLGKYSGTEGKWSPFFANAVWNFTEKKLSPFVSVKAGVCIYDFGYIPSEFPIKTRAKGPDFYAGLTGGVQYSLTKNFALKADIGLYWSAGIGAEVGVIYHF